ncbi:MAG: hypothetical protein J3K34DRAFT_524846 [Monoraphidium minutum]|nr:MAG: hypothetical protein J3K34DRAFT_524846 [Monoraphidium minutum]
MNSYELNNSGFSRYLAALPGSDSMDLPMTPGAAAAPSSGRALTPGTANFDPDYSPYPPQRLFGDNSTLSFSPLCFSPMAQAGGVADTPGDGDAQSPDDAPHAAHSESELAGYNARARAALLAAGFAESELRVNAAGFVEPALEFDGDYSDDYTSSDYSDDITVADEQDAVAAAAAAAPAVFAAPAAPAPALTFAPRAASPPLTIDGDVFGARRADGDGDVGPVAARTRAKAPGHICVVGGGVAGLTTALRLLREIPGCCVQVYAEAWGNDLVTAGAAGYWEPYKLSDTPPDLVHKWGKATFEHLQGLVHSPAAAAAGVSTVYAASLFREPTPDPFWSDIVGGFCRVPPADLARYSGSADWGSQIIQEASGAAGTGRPGAWVDGYAFNSLVCEGRLYMRWLADEIREAGGQLAQRGLDGLGELGEEGYDAVVVACGLGAKELLGDEACYPIRGQIARVRAPWVRQCVFGHWGDEVTYVIPNREWVVIGGTGQVGDWRTTTDLGDAEAIMQRAVQLLPSLEGAELLDHWVGLRPGRSQLRLGCEWVKLQPGGASSSGESDNGVVPSGGAAAAGGGRGGGRTPVIYNYGHGGAGLTLAWGCAGDAVELVRQALA